MKHEFEQIGDIADSTLILKFPGTDIRMPFTNGEAYMNRLGMVFVSFNFVDSYAVKNGEPKGAYGIVGQMISDELANPMLKARTLENFRNNPCHLFYSLGKAGIEVLTIPGMESNSTCEMDNRLVTFYETRLYDAMPTMEKVQELHKNSAGLMELAKDRRSLDKEVLKIISKANESYEQAMHAMRQY